MSDDAASMRDPAVGEFQDVPIDDVIGEIPEDLAGTLFRNGPARWDAGGFHAGHLFDGDGMITKFSFRDGKLRYRNRYVRTPKYRAEERGRGSTVRGMGTDRPGGPLANLGRLPKDRANTHAVYHAEQLLALSDDGRPWRIDPATLETLGRCTFGGRLKPWSTFSPHPKFDPATGELFNFGLSIAAGIPRPGAVASLRCYRVSDNGDLTQFNSVNMSRAYINHDCGLTPRYLVFLLDPLYVKHPLEFGLGLLDANSATVHDPALGSKVVLVPRDGGTPLQFDIETIAKAHVNNAFEDRGDIVIDVVRYDDWDAMSAVLTNFRDHDAFSGGTASRVRITPGKQRATVEDLCGVPTEFPMHDWRRTGRDYRYAYLVFGDGRDAGIVKLDNTDGSIAMHTFETGDFPGEPVFVPRPGSSAEDDGWILALNYDHARHRTALVILDARAIDAKPVAVATLPHHFMPGFHGMFTPASP